MSSHEGGPLLCGVALLALSALLRSLALLLGLMAGEGISDPITRMRMPVFAKVTRLDLPPSEGGCNGSAARSDEGILSLENKVRTNNCARVISSRGY